MQQSNTHMYHVQSGGKEKLSRALDNIVDAEPPCLFAGRFQLLKQRRLLGSQGLVVFAQEEDQFFAIKCGPTAHVSSSSQQGKGLQWPQAHMSRDMLHFHCKLELTAQRSAAAPGMTALLTSLQDHQSCVSLQILLARRHLRGGGAAVRRPCAEMRAAQAALRHRQRRRGTDSEPTWLQVPAILCARARRDAQRVAQAPAARCGCGRDGGGAGGAAGAAAQPRPCAPRRQARQRALSLIAAAAFAALQGLFMALPLTSGTLMIWMKGR